MDLFTGIVTIIAGIIAAGASLFNTKKQIETNETNLEYNEKMTSEQWARDERAIQTQVQDAQAAGISPLAVINGGGATVSNAIPANAQAPNLDLTNMLSMFTSMAGIQEQKRHNKASEETTKYGIDKTAENLEKQLKNNYEIADMQDATKQYEINENIKNFNNKLAQEERIFTKNIENQYISKAIEQVNSSSQSELERIQKSLGISVRTREFTIKNKTELQAYIKIKQKWANDYLNALENAKIGPDESSSSTSETTSGGGGIGAASVNINANGSESKSESKSANLTRINTKKLTTLMSNFPPYPIPIFTEEYYK